MSKPLAAVGAVAHRMCVMGAMRDAGDEMRDAHDESRATNGKKEELEMKIFRSAVLAAILLGLPGVVFAQLPGEPKTPGTYDPTGDAKYRFQRGAPDERVREAQRVLREKGYYRGPVDGMMSPELRRAVWNFQKAEGLMPSGQLEASTMAALGLASTGTAVGPETQPSALPRSFGSDPSRSGPAPNTFQAP